MDPQPPELLLSDDPISTHVSTGVSEQPGPIRGHAAYPSDPRMTLLHLLPREMREALWSWMFCSMANVEFYEYLSYVYHMDQYWDIVVNLNM